MGHSAIKPKGKAKREVLAKPLVETKTLKYDEDGYPLLAVTMNPPSALPSLATDAAATEEDVKRLLENVKDAMKANKPNEEGFFVKDGVVMHDLVHRVKEEMKNFVGEVTQHIEPAEEEFPEHVGQEPAFRIELEFGEDGELHEVEPEPAPKPKATRKKKVKEEE